MKLFSYLMSAGLALVFTTGSWADDPAKPAIPAKPPEAAKPEAKKGKRVAKGDKAKGARKARVKPSRPVLVQSMEKDMLVVKSPGQSKKATASEKKYTVNENTKILVVDKGKKKARGEKGKPTKAGTREDLKQGTKIVVLAKGEIAESVTVMAAQAKAAKKGGKAKKAKVIL